MGLIDVLGPGRILVDPPSKTKEELLEALVRLVTSDADWTAGRTAESVLEVVLAREEQLSTGLQEGIAIPHGMIDDKIATLGALAIVPGGLDFACMDGEPATFVVLLIFADTADGRGQHVGLLAETVSLLTNPQLRAALLAAAGPEEVWSHLLQAPPLK